jgi:uncharacterized membrane protein YeaQ/YmgE (transglycosylase-associated protein family)
MNLLYFVMIPLWVVLGLLCGWLAGVVWKKPRPFGMGGDLIAGLLTVIIVGLADWFLVPAIGIHGISVLIIAILEPVIGAFIVFWLMRLYKK